MRATRSVSGIVLTLGLLGTAPVLRGAGSDSTPRGRPNVLFIAADDLNCNVGCYGHPFAKTPNIDRLASRGVRFARAYCQVALCNPSRTSLLSGRRPDTTRVFDNKIPPRTALGSAVFLPEFFRQHGYFTARVGKIAHGDFEQAIRWDVAEDPYGLANDKLIDVAPDNPGIRSGTPVVSWARSEQSDENQTDGRTARRIMELLGTRHRRPFFIAAGFHKPHLPWAAPQKYFDLFPPDRIALPEKLPNGRGQFPPLALRTTRPDGAGLSDAQVRESIAAYTACSAFADAQTGLLLEALDRNELWENTIVVFWGDHGFHLGDHGGLWGKLTLFEQAAHVPLIVAAPGKRSGVACERLVELVDLYPTLVELCRLQQPAQLEGTSFAPLLDDPARPWKSAAFTQVRRPSGAMGRSLRTERWRYTEWDRPGVVELYDHARDPQELQNLANDSQQRQTLANLRQLLHNGWRQARPETSTLTRQPVKVGSKSHE